MEAFATVKELQEYTGVYPENEETLKLYLNSASEIIVNYVGYDPHIADNQEYYNGMNDTILFLNSKPINKINSLKINGDEIPIENVIIGKSSISLKNGFFPSGKNNIEINYNSGWNELPELFKITCLRIAAILETESDSNIGITSKSFADSGSRTFFNFTNFNKYLMQLSEFQIM